MILRFHNTLTRRKEDFVPFDPANVRVYGCGPTVYDNLHIGNGRMLIVFDVLFRLLRHTYGAEHVTYVRNITDVDDKINARAAERGIDIRALTDAMITIFHEDAAALGCLTPTLEPRATDHIAPMIEIMRRLIANGHAYAAEGHVLFDVPSMPDYGRLANKSMDEQLAGARVEVAPYKRSATDFVLWKPSAPNEPGWNSPWGRGRPGWHLECSAMSWQLLGETFDIHGGGIDLVFPHHENEIAQSRCAFGHDIMAKVWMHNGHLQVEHEKMSKSLGNFITIRDLWASAIFGGKAWSGDTLRLAMLRTHYRQPIDFTIKGLDEGRPHDFRLFQSLRRCLSVSTERWILGSDVRRHEHTEGSGRASREPQRSGRLAGRARSLGHRGARAGGSVGCSRGRGADGAASGSARDQRVFQLHCDRARDAAFNGDRCSFHCEPRGHIREGVIADLSRANEVAQRLHDFVHGRDAIPDVHPVEIDIIGVEPRERSIERAVNVLRTVTSRVGVAGTGLRCRQRAR